MAIRDLDQFDTMEARARLANMSQEELQEIIRSGAYRESLDRMNEVRKRLKERFARKDQIIDAICAASVAGVPTVLIGPPGTAKSNIIRCFCEGLGLSSHREQSDGTGADRQYFEYLLTRYTTPEEIFGPIHVQELIEKQTYRRVTTGYLPEAQVGFLDEIFKASSAIVNTLLTILNERIFYNAGKAQRVPLIMIFAASNEAPTDETLAALYDRFPLRLNCPAVEEAHLGDLLKLSWEQAYDRLFASERLAVPRCACTNDIRLLTRVMRVSFGGRFVGESRRAGGFDFSDEFLRAFRSLRNDYSISDRTMGLLLAFARSLALLNSKAGLTVDELDVFRYVMWDQAGTGELDRTVANIKRGVRI